MSIKMKNNLQKFKIYSGIILFFLILGGIYLSFVGGYGSDEDTLALIGAYESMKGGEKLMASRFTPYPVAEIGIGFLSYQFGSIAANLVTFLFIILSCFFFYISLSKKHNFEEILFFLILCLSNPILYFDNIEPIDYSWALIFLSLGLFVLKKKYFELAILFFGISVGTRINFVLFVFVIIFFLDNFKQLKFFRRIVLFISSFFIGGLFYLPIWYQYGFGIEWLTAVTPNNQGLIGLLSRFIYKTLLSITIISSLYIFLLFLQKKNLNKLFKVENIRLILSIILSNLTLFFLIPAELSYLQPFLVSLYFLIFKLFSKKIVAIIIILNFSSWIVDINLLDIKYKSDDFCNNVEAISAKINLKLENGRFYKYIDSRDKIKCWVLDDSERSKKIISGKALKN